MSTTNTVNLSDSVADFDMPAPGTPGYEEFRKTGKLPEAEPEVKIETEPSKKEADSAPAEKVVTRAESAPAKPQGKKTGDTRIQELANKNRELQERLDRLEKAPEKRESAASQPAPEKKEPEKKAKPKLGDNDPKTGKPFLSIEAWSDAVDEWNEERTNRILEERLATERQTYQQTENERIVAAETYRRAQPAMEKYPDFLEVVQNPALLMPKGSTVTKFLLNPKTKNVGEITYYLGKHPEILQSFYEWDGPLDKGSYKDKVDPIEQLRTLMEIEREVSAEPKPEKKAPASTMTQAPRPPHQVSGKAPAPDAIGKAVEDGDQAEYTRSMNARAVESRKASRR